MRSLGRFAAFAGALLPAAALAETDGHGDSHEFYIVDMLPMIVNFIILLVVFIWLFRDGVSSFLKRRKAEVEKALEEAATIKAEAEAKQKEYSERLSKLDAELEQMRKDMLEAGEAERDRIVQQAEERAARMRKEAEFVIEQHAKQLRIELTREAVDAAVAAASDLLAKSATPQDQQRLAEQYLAQFQQKTGPDSIQPKASSTYPPQESRA